jgi:hypothetical protein
MVKSNGLSQETPFITIIMTFFATIYVNQITISSAWIGHQIAQLMLTMHMELCGNFSTSCRNQKHKISKNTIRIYRHVGTCKGSLAQGSQRIFHLQIRNKDMPLDCSFPCVQ